VRSRLVEEEPEEVDGGREASGGCLSPRGVIIYLLRRGLLDEGSIVSGDLVVRSASSRNENITVERSKGPSYFLKQALDEEGRAALRHEAGLYERLARSAPDFSRFLPRCYGYDEDANVLLLEFISGGEDLRRMHLRRGRFPVGLASVVGRALGTLHRATAAAHPTDPPASIPWIFGIHRPSLGLFRDLSAATIEAIKIIQTTPGFGDLLDGLWATWEPSALIHHDVKWDNFVVLPSRRSQPRQLKLVDWEAAVWGDPAWDVGSVFSHYLSLWMFSIPITGQVPPEKFPELARYPLESMRPAIRRCWDAYLRTTKLDDAATQECQARSVRYAAARLLQTVVESTQASSQLTSNAVLHLQLSVNILQRPMEGATRLLGLPPSEAVAG
jgi:Ser/Thr protein kinase RdoA (MazF antagonist)